MKYRMIKPIGVAALSCLLLCILTSHFLVGIKIKPITVFGYFNGSLLVWVGVFGLVENKKNIREIDEFRRRLNIK